MSRGNSLSRGLRRASSLKEGAFGMAAKFSGVSKAPSQRTPSPGRGKSFLKGRGLGKEMKFAWTAKGSPFGRAGKSKGFD